MLAVSATALVSDLGEPTADLRYEDLQAGLLLPMFCGPTLWSSLPSIPRDVTAIVDLAAFGYVGVCLVSVALMGWRWRMTSPTGAAMLTLGLGMFPSILGAVVLQDRLATPAVAGAWVSFMIVGLLYAALAALVLAISDLSNLACIPALKFKRTASLVN